MGSNESGTTLLAAVMMLMLLTLYSLSSFEQVKLQSRQIASLNLNRQALVAAEIAANVGINEIKVMDANRLEQLIIREEKGDGVLVSPFESSYWQALAVASVDLKSMGFKEGEAQYFIEYLGQDEGSNEMVFSPKINSLNYQQAVLDKTHLFKITARGRSGLFHQRLLEIYYRLVGRG